MAEGAELDRRRDYDRRDHYRRDEPPHRGRRGDDYFDPRDGGGGGRGYMDRGGGGGRGYMGRPPPSRPHRGGRGYPNRRGPPPRRAEDRLRLFREAASRRDWKDDAMEYSVEKEDDHAPQRNHRPSERDEHAIGNCLRLLWSASPPPAARNAPEERQKRRDEQESDNDSSSSDDSESSSSDVVIVRFLGRLEIGSSSTSSSLSSKSRLRRRLSSSRACRRALFLCWLAAAFFLFPAFA